jgi:hypothetical protein
MSLQEIWQRVTAEISRLFGLLWNYPIPWVQLMKVGVILVTGFVVCLILMWNLLKIKALEDREALVIYPSVGLGIAAASYLGYLIW